MLVWFKLLVVWLLACFGILAEMMPTGGRGRRRTGPEPVGEPSDEDRAAVERMHQDQRERIAAERQAQADQAEPAGEPPSDQQRQAIREREERVSDTRAAVARASRRAAQPVSDPDDGERDTIAGLHEQAREARLDELDDRGIVDPSIEEQSAGFDPTLPHMPASELYGAFACEKCGGTIERNFPGYVDFDAAQRDVVCPHCGHRHLAHGSAVDEPSEAATPSGGVQTSAQPDSDRMSDAAGTAGPTGPGEASAEPPTATAAPLSDDERADLERLRADKLAREQQQPPPPQG